MVRKVRPESMARLSADCLRTTGQEEERLIPRSIAHLEREERSAKLTVVAEGAETEKQSRLLRLLSCDEIQGYLLSKRAPCEIFQSAYLAAPGMDPGFQRHF